MALSYSCRRCGSKHMNRKSEEEREKEHYQRWIMELLHEDSFGIQEDPRYTVISAVLEMPNGASKFKHCIPAVTVTFMKWE